MVRRKELIDKLLEALDEAYREEIERLRGAIETHMAASLELVKDDPRVRLSEADYQLWEMLREREVLR